jgi:thioredoxin reductase (NADPH)
VHAIELAPPEGDPLTLPCDVLVQCLGLSPKLGPISEWGMDMARRQIRVNTQDFSTSLSGVYAVGDINHYPGKRKLIACGFHEATLAAYGLAERLAGGQITQEYTTASERLHARLKV